MIFFIEAALAIIACIDHDIHRLMKAGLVAKFRNIGLELHQFLPISALDAKVRELWPKRGIHSGSQSAPPIVTSQQKLP